jgi:hypothetical protein
MIRHMKAVVVQSGDEQAIRITEQTHHGENFTCTGHIFTSRIGFSLHSASYPEYPAKEYNTRCFVQGVTRSHDNDLITGFNDAWLSKFRQAVREYNEQKINSMDDVIEEPVIEVIE